MPEGYLDLDLDLKRTGYFAVSVLVAAAVVTIVYWAIFGFDRWKGEIQSASNLMMAAYVPAQVQQQPQTGTGIAGQYICPQDGAVGLPRLDSGGVPHCPICGQVMTFNRLTSNLSLAQGFG